MVVMQPSVSEYRPPTSIEEGSSSDTATSLLPAEATTSLAPVEATTSLPPAEATTSLPPAAATTSLAPVEVTTPSSSWPRSLLPRWLSKSSKQGLVCGTDPNGVKLVPAAAKGIGKLTALQTLGVVNVGTASGGNTILRELTMLTQLRKLRLSGINLKNWKNFCYAISGHHCNLESLSVRLDEDPTTAAVFANFSEISEPPKTLKTLKVYGKNTCISPVWIKQLHNLTKVDINLTLSTQEDIDYTMEWPRRDVLRHACVMPINEGKLIFGFENETEEVSYFDLINLHVLKIDCRYRLVFSFQFAGLPSLEVLVIHCSTVESSLKVSGLQRLHVLKEVWLTGSYSNELKRHLQQEVAEHHNKPVLKLEAQPRSSSVSYCSCV
jgi:hypothetical protein